MHPRWLFVMVAIVLISPHLSHSVSMTDAPPCGSVSLDVALADGQPRSYKVGGWLCEVGRDTIVVMVAGATESGIAYWDFPGPAQYLNDPKQYGPLHERYSFARYLARAGYASLTLDRIGTGISSRPPAAQVTIESNMFVVHQVVQALKQGTLARRAYSRVIGAGRSLSAPMLWMQAGRYPDDLQGIIVQGFRRHQTPHFAEFPTWLMPAQLEPRLASAPLGYLTTREGTREAFFLPAADPTVMAIDERTKETITDGEIVTFPPSWDHSFDVRVPIISVIGGHDTFFCSEPNCPEASQEESFFPNAPCFDSVVISNAGHQMNLQDVGPAEVFPTMLNWIQRTFGPEQLTCGG